MAASSPSPSSNGLSSAAAAATPPKTLRGLNKPKCIQCGNVARSRCPYQSCKGCCSRAENPCPIHVLKASTGVGEKTPAQSTPSSEQKSSEGASGTSSRLASVRQLSSNFAQFNNLSVPVRPKRPLTREDAIALNGWRFAKLKEYRDRNIEAENESFDRYMKNVNLLEEVCSLTSAPEDDPSATSEQKDDGIVLSGMKLKLRSNSTRTDNFRERIRQIVDKGLAKVQKHELDGRTDGSSDQDELERRAKRNKWEERASASSELIDKLNKARTEDDLKSCIEIKTKLYQTALSNRAKNEAVEVSGDSSERNEGSLGGFLRTTEICQETLQRIDEHFCSLDQIESL